MSGIGQSADLVTVTVLRNFANALPRRCEGEKAEEENLTVSHCARCLSDPGRFYTTCDD